MGCVYRSYPRFEYLYQMGLLGLRDNAYDKIKASIRNSDYKDFAINKFIYAYRYDVTTHGLQLDFDRYLLMHLLTYKQLIEPFSSERYHLDLDRLDSKLHALLLQDSMLKATNDRLREFFEDFKEDLRRLTPKQRIEVALNTTRQLAILLGGNWDVVDKLISIEKSLGLHALKRLAGSQLFWNYFMLAVSVREHYSSLLEKEKILLKAGQDNLLKPDDWELVRKWYERSGTLTDIEFHLRNAQQLTEKFIFEFDWLPSFSCQLWD